MGVGAVSAAFSFAFPALSSLANFSTFTALTTVLDFTAMQSSLTLIKMRAKALTGEIAGRRKDIFLAGCIQEGKARRVLSCYNRHSMCWLLCSCKLLVPLILNPLNTCFYKYTLFPKLSFKISEINVISNFLLCGNFRILFLCLCALWTFEVDITCSISLPVSFICFYLLIVLTECVSLLQHSMIYEIIL